MREWLLNELGAVAFTKLMQAYGGGVLHVPMAKRGKAFAALGDVIGEVAAAKLVDIAMGDRLYIAFNTLHERWLRRAAFLRLRCEGKSIAEIQRTYTTPPRHLSERTIRKELSELSTANTAQLEIAIHTPPVGKFYVGEEGEHGKAK